jgi:hypothetical protein
VKPRKEMVVRKLDARKSAAPEWAESLIPLLVLVVSALGAGRKEPSLLAVAAEKLELQAAMRAAAQ